MAQNFTELCLTLSNVTRTHTHAHKATTGRPVSAATVGEKY